MTVDLDIADIPPMVLRRTGAFEAAQYPPEWSFWLYVAEKEGPDTLALAEANARFFLEHYVGFDKRPPGYREAIAKHRKQWWAAIPRPAELEAGVWALFNLLHELEHAAEELGSDFSIKRKKNVLTVSARTSLRSSARVEFETGEQPNLVHIRIYHPLTNRHYHPEWFFGYFGTGQLRIWAISQMEETVRRVLDFSGRLLPLLAASTRARPPVPYSEVRDGEID